MQLTVEKTQSDGVCLGSHRKFTIQKMHFRRTEEKSGLRSRTIIKPQNTCL